MLINLSSAIQIQYFQTWFQESVPIADVMRRDKALFFFKISPVNSHRPASLLFRKPIYLIDIFILAWYYGERGRGMLIDFQLSVFISLPGCISPLPPISPRFWLAAIYRSRGFSKFIVIHKVISRLRSIVIRFYPRRRLKIFHGATFLASNKYIDRFIFEANSYRLNSYVLWRNIMPVFLYFSLLFYARV